MKSLVALSVFAGAIGAAHAAGADICPASITTAQTIKSVPAAYQVIVPAAVSKLKGVTFWEATKKGWSLRNPDDDYETESNWTFVDGEGAIRIQCAYDGTLVVLQRDLGTNLATCKITYLRTPAGAPKIIQKAVCD